MKISMWNLKEWFQKHHLDCSYRILDNYAYIDAVRFLEAGQERDPESRSKNAETMADISEEQDQGGIPDGGTAFVMDGEMLREASGFRTALVYDHDQILFPAAAPNEVLNSALDLIGRMNEWETQLLDRAMESPELDGYLNFAAQEFHFPMMLAFYDHSLRYQSGDWQDSMPAREINRLRQKVLQHKGDPTPFFSHSASSLPRRTLLLRGILFQGEIRAVLIARENEEPFTSGDIILMEQIAKTIETVFFFRTGESGTLHPLSHWFSEQLVNPDRVNLSYRNMITLTDWHENDIFCITAIQSNKADAVPQPSSLAYYFSEEFCHASIQGRLFILSHLKSTALSPEGTLKHPPLSDQMAKSFETFLKAHDYRAGFTLPFRGLKNTGSYARQALMVLNRNGQSSRIMSGAASSLETMILDICQQLSGQKQYIRPELLDLARSGRHTDPDDIQLLYIYLVNGCSITRTSELLFLHRNTLRNRLNQIRDMLHVTLESGEEKKDLLTELLLLYHPIHPQAGS